MKNRNDSYNSNDEPCEKGKESKLLIYTYRDVDDTAQYSIMESYLQCEGS